MATIKSGIDVRQENAQAQADTRFRSVVEGSIQGIMIRTAEQLQYVNAACAQMFGYDSPAELVGQPWTRIVAPEEIPLHRARAEACLRGETLPPLSGWQGIRKDGARIWLESVARPFTWEGQRAILAFVVDITERKRAEQSLRASETRFRTLIEQAADAIFLHAENGSIVDVNRRACENLGYTRDELIGMSIPQFDPFVTQEEIELHFKQLQSGKSVALESRHLRKDGTSFPVEIRVAPMQLDGHLHMLSIVTDITERKRAEDALRAAQQRLQHVVTSSPAVLFTLGVDQERFTGIAWISDNVATMLGYPVEQALAANWWLGNVHPDDLDEVLSTVHRELFSNDFAANEYRFCHKDGTYRWVRSELRLLRDAAGNPREAVGSLSEISQQKQLEGQFRQAQKMEAVGRLAGGVAHDFNNLLTVILGYSDVILASFCANESLHDMMNQIKMAGERAASLTRQLLAFSRKQLLVPVILDINALLNDMATMLCRLLGENIDLQIHAADGLWTVKADAGQIEQVIMNLAVNASDAMPQGGKLTIESTNVELATIDQSVEPNLLPGPYVVLTVSDTGCGMDDATKARLFEPFFTTKSVDKGTGLGLSTVYGIVKQSGGHIEVHSNLGFGTTFRIYLPRTQERAKNNPVAPLSQPIRGTETVLLVEDEVAVRDMARLILQSHGYKVLEAENGVEALKVAQQYPSDIHLLASDVVMPKMNGRELAEALTVLRPNMRILYVSGYTHDTVVRHGIVDGKMPFLQKPFTPLEFARKVRELLD